MVSDGAFIAYHLIYLTKLRPAERHAAAWKRGFGLDRRGLLMYR
jgi:hypothetical protein